MIPSVLDSDIRWADSKLVSGTVEKPTLVVEMSDQPQSCSDDDRNETTRLIVLVLSRTW